MAVRASRTSSSLNGLIIAITIFMGPIPAWARSGRGRAFLDWFATEKFTTRAQPRPIESNAVPDRAACLTDYENGCFRVWRVLRCSALLRRAQYVTMSDQNTGTTGCRHNDAHASGSKKVIK